MILLSSSLNSFIQLLGVLLIFLFVLVITYFTTKDWRITEGPDVRTQLSGGRYHTDRQQQTGSGNKNGRCVSCDRGCKR